MRKTIVATTALTSLLLASHAEASGIATARFGGEHGTPMTDTPPAIYYNPAGIGLSEGINIYVDGSFAMRWASYEHSAAATDVPEPADAQGANTGKGTLGNFLAVPMAGATAKFPLTDSLGLTAGAAFFVPFGGTSMWDQNDAFAKHQNYAGPVDGVNRWYSIHGTIRTLMISGAAALSINDMIHLGVSGGAAISQVDSLRARNSNGNDDMTFEGRAWVKTSTVHGQLGGGVMVTPLEDPKALRIGLSYQAPPGISDAKSEGTLSMYLGGNPSVADIQIGHQMPDIFRLGAAYRPTDELELRLFGDYTRWSLFENMCIETVGNPCEVDETGAPADGTSPTLNIRRNWQDSFALRAGLSYWVIPEVELMVGLGYDANAIPDENLDPALLDFHDVSTALGGRFEVTDWLAAQLTYTHLFYISRDTTGKSSNATLHPTSRGPDAGGVYKQTIGVINVGLQGSFDVFADESEPRRTEPAPTEPAPTEPAPTEPAPTEPPPIEPPPTEPAPTEPPPTEPAPTEPAPTEPAPAEPAPAEPAPG